MVDNVLVCFIFYKKQWDDKEAKVKIQRGVKRKKFVFKYQQEDSKTSRIYVVLRSCLREEGRFLVDVFIVIIKV